NKPYCGTGVFLLRGDSFLSVFWLWFEASYSHSANFLRQQNGALSVEILYFLAGSVMHHSGVVKAPQRCSSVRGWFR
ncbi:TPA: hypothetical protein ACIX03_005036, partial [Escherichia coli]